MSLLEVKPQDSCQIDQVSLGEVMLRLDPGASRIRTARHFRAWEGGGEYNVARGLRRCFEMRTAIVTALADNEVGRLIEDLMLQGGLDVSCVKWVTYDGIGREVRNGLNFTERGFGVRGAIGCSDRGHTAIAQLKVREIDWDHLFGTLGVRWFHTGGIFAALSDSTAAVVEEALIKARRYRVVTSYDLNYRPSLWKSIGGQRRAQEVNRRIVRLVDVLIGNEEDFTACLGLKVDGTDEQLASLPIDAYRHMIGRAIGEYPNIRATATTLRVVHSAGINDWGALAWYNGEFYEATNRTNLEILDRVGGGDSFASGFIYGMMTTGNAQLAVEYGAAHGALAMTSPGDTTMASHSEVEKLVQGGSARVDR
ncbi:MAG: sugar kinase [Planctomycetota bacterium]